MPYRRLPTTDKARLRALDAALKMALEKEAGRRAFSEKNRYELQNVKTSFENHLKQYELDLKKETENTPAYKAARDKARIYVSHFIQMVYMSIEREELKPEACNFYGLQEQEMKVPSLNTEEEVLNWGWKLMDGEQKRMQQGGSPFYNPSIALVKVQIENFRDAAFFQKNLKKNTLRSYGRMEEIRKSTNEFIRSLWSEIEENVAAGSPGHKRQQAEEYGVVYVFRRNEKKVLRSEGMQVDLLFEFS